MREELLEQHGALDRALSEFEKVRDYIDNPDTPGPRGPVRTQHGEIAEKVTVAIRRARDFVKQHDPIATAEGAGSRGPVDYFLGDVPVQSKYAQSTRLSLDHCLEHLVQYPDFKRDGIFHIPSDQYDQLVELRDTGSIPGLSRTQADSVSQRLQELESRLGGRAAMEAIGPGEAAYDEVQRDHVRRTLEDGETIIRDKSSEREAQIHDDHAPSLDGLGLSTALGGVAGGGVRIAHTLVAKYRDGRNVFKGELTAQDWNDVVGAGGKGSIAGSISGSVLYGLTNLTDLAAPFAGSFVSAVSGTRELHRSYRSGEVDADEFADLSHFVACEAAIVGVAAAAGQAAIPVPMLGAFLGSVAGKIVASKLKTTLETGATELATRLHSYEVWAMERLDSECRECMKRLDSHFMDMDRLSRIAFDPATNTALRLRASVELARSVHVSENLILNSAEELDEFIMD